MWPPWCWNLNSIQKVKEGNHRPASHQLWPTSRQPPAAVVSRLHTTVHNRLHTWRLNFLVLNSCINRVLSLCYYVWERIERNTREKERGRVLSFLCIVSYLFLVIKQCVLSPPSVSRPPPVVPPTNNWYQSPVRQKTEVFWEISEFSKLSKTSFDHSTV